MKIVVTGMPYFAKKIQEQLSNFDKENKYIYLNTFYNKIDKLKYLFHIVNSDILYMIGGSVSNSGSISLALKLNKKIILHWSGTDVLTAIKIVNNNLHDKRYINKITHLCETTWIQKELLQINIKSTVLPRMVYDKPRKLNLELSKKFTVSSYVGKNREKFYGIDILIKLANDFSNIEFRIAGIESYKNIPDNLKLLGWVNMEEEYKSSIVYIRTPEHDGLGFSVLEALSYGIVVFRNYKFPFTNYFKDYDDLKQQLSKMIDDFNNGKVTVNQEAIDFVQTEFSEEKVLGNLVKVFNGS